MDEASPHPSTFSRTYQLQDASDNNSQHIVGARPQSHSCHCNSDEGIQHHCCDGSCLAGCVAKQEVQDSLDRQVIQSHGC